MCYGLNQECDNNIKKIPISKGTTLHNFNMLTKLFELTFNYIVNYQMFNLH